MTISIKNLPDKVKMIDIHCHILPGLDDGPRSLEEALQMCLLSYKDGVRTIVATPHILKGVYSNDRLTIIKGADELKTALIRHSISFNDSHFTRHSSPPLRILPGADIHFSEEIVRELEAGNILTVCDGGKFLFVEFPFQGIPYRAEEVLFQLLGRGIVPIITHPERNLEIAQRPKRYYEMIRIGCLGQLTAMSLTGDFGPKIKKIAEELLRHKLVHFIASDAHSIDGRPPILSNGVRAAERVIGKQEARKMVDEYPKAILNGQKPHLPEPIPI